MPTNIDLVRGGAPVFRPAFCCGAYPKHEPICNIPHFPGTPPFDTHADGAHGQGYLNLMYPFVPNLLETDAHRWMQAPLQNLSAVNDVIRLIWVPTYSYVDSLIISLTKYDTALNGVYLQPVSERYWWNPSTKACEYKANDLFTEAFSNYANATKICLGKPAAASGDTPADSSYIHCRFPQTDSIQNWAFGHDLYKFNDQGEPTGPEDEYTGMAVFGLKIVSGDASKIKNIWRSNFELWINLKVLCHECSGFTG